MADPHLTPELDGFDRFTIVSYRVGLAISAVGLGWTAMAIGGGRPAVGTFWVVWLGVTLCAGNLHLYSKQVRWLILWFALSALLLRSLGSLVPDAWIPQVATVANGLVLASLSGVVLKEWFCFRMPLVQATPAALAMGLLTRFGGADTAAAFFFGLGSLGVGLIAVAKARMPLGHDLGDRSAYEI